eukprot:gene20794-32046_t
MNVAKVIGLVALMIGVSNADSSRNGYMLDPDSGLLFGIIDNPLNTHGFDWWWHSFVAVNRETGAFQPFFIAYYAMNPGLGGAEPVLGQAPENQAAGVPPSYAMIKAGTWAENASLEIHNFYGIDDFAAEVEYMDVRIGEHFANETALKGSVSMSAEDAADPKYMSDAGEMSWDLSIVKDLSYSVGIGTSEPLRDLSAFDMYWHVEGMKSRLSGTVTLNGESFDVLPASSAGYQDKNWGKKYTNPWVWINCNRLFSDATGKLLEKTSLDVGGADPRVFGVSLGRQLLIAFYHEGELYEWNFTKELVTQTFEVTETVDKLRWQVASEDLRNRIVIDFSAPKSRCLLIDYENPAGEKNHNALWNTGWAAGTVTLYKRTLFGWKEIDSFTGELGGAEY